jgi:RNA recognition motif-containing protein
MANLYVGNLPYSVTEEELEKAFAAYGAVSAARVVTDRATGRPRGFGFVEMENDDEANAAIEALNGTDMGGRKLVVNIARPKQQ